MHLARIAWKFRTSRIKFINARLLELNPHGATLFVYQRFAEGRRVWFGLGSLPHEWVKASVVSSKTVVRGFLCRLEFCEECAPGLLEGAQAGLAMSHSHEAKSVLSSRDARHGGLQ